MAHVNALYDAAQEKIINGAWAGPSVFEILTKDGRVFKFQYISFRAFELGKMYIGQKRVAFVIDPIHRALGDAGVRTIRSISFSDDALKKEHSRHMPKVEESLILRSGELFVLIKKEINEFSLREVLEFYGGKLDPKHVAWILSSLYNINCFLEIIGIVHCDISLDSYFISPTDHNGRLVGGWWFSSGSNKPLRILPSRTVKYGPPSLRVEKRARRIVDSEMIKQLGKELLGHPNGAPASCPKGVPEPMWKFLTGIDEYQAFAEYAIWSRKVLNESFGARRFVKLEYPESAATVN